MTDIIIAQAIGTLGCSFTAGTENIVPYSMTTHRVYGKVKLMELAYI
jgi:hypothetical protein